MSTAHPSAALLVADPDPELRASTAAALRGAGWEVEVVGDLEACREALARRPRAALIATELAPGSPVDLVRSLRDEQDCTGVRLILIYDPELDLDWAELARVGVDEFLERPLRPALLCHRLHRVLPAEGSDPDAPGTWLEPDAFTDGLGRRLVSANSDESKVAVLAAEIEVPGRDWSTLSPAENRTLSEKIGHSLRAAFDGDEADEDLSLSSLLPGVRLCRLQPNVVLMMIPGITRLQDTAKLGGRLQEQLLQTIDADDAAGAVQVGLGVAAFPEDGSGARSLMRNATEAARRARREGSSLMIFHTEAMGRWAFERLTLERSLREAIAREELRVYYQPRIDAETRAIKGMEALVRWQHPELGLVPPMQFIPLAEETGLIVPIGEWVLREACRQNKAWRDAGLPPVSVSVNLSPVQFKRADLYDTVIDALRAADLPEGALELEVTESMLMFDPKKTIKTLQRLKDAGIHISIDDFGTGYSSLSYLKRFPIDALKIDRSFVMDVTNNPDDAAITTAIILMGHSLKLSVVAEGVETESQFEFLRVLKCNEIQGYLFSPPVPADKAAELLRNQSSDSIAA